MPMRFSDLSRKTRPVTLDLGDGDAINAHYRHGLLTPRLVHDLLALEPERVGNVQRASETEAALDAVCGHTVTLVADWDLLDDDGVTPYPLTVERLRDIPVHVQIALIRLCVADMNQGEAQPAKDSPTGRASDAGSLPMARSARRRTGTR